MDLENVRKSLTKRPALPNKRIAFIVLAGLLLAGGAIWRVAYYVNAPQAASPQTTSPEAASPQATSPQAAPAMSSVKTDLPPPQPAAKEAEPATASLPPPAPLASPQAPSPPAPSPQAASPQVASPQVAPPSEQAAGSPSSALGEPTQPASADQGSQGSEASGPILISKRPVQVLAGPSSTSPALYGFPSGRPFRLIGHQGNFAQIKDLRSGASGWIDETALAELPPSYSRSSGSSPSLSSSASQPRSAAAGQPQGAPKSRGAGKGGQVTADQQPNTTDTDSMPSRRPGLIGGILGGIFGGN
jgi:hypothetical protein